MGRLIATKKRNRVIHADLCCQKLSAEFSILSAPESSPGSGLARTPNVDTAEAAALKISAASPFPSRPMMALFSITALVAMMGRYYHRGPLNDRRIVERILLHSRVHSQFR